jgi:hypothetical protein
MKTTFDIPQGNSKEEMLLRKKIIKDFYAIWNAANPTKRIYNTSLNEFISVRYLSINETSKIASIRYLSTLALTHYFTEILELAKVVKRTKPKQGNENQKRFSEIIILEYNKENIGVIKLTVGILKGSTQHIQYCITAIENG